MLSPIVQKYKSYVRQFQVVCQILQKLLERATICIDDLCTHIHAVCGKCLQDLVATAKQRKCTFQLDAVRQTSLHLENNDID